MTMLKVTECKIPLIHLTLESLAMRFQAASLAAAADLRGKLDGGNFFVYLGGHHLAVHRETGQINKGPRIALIIESPRVD